MTYAERGNQIIKLDIEQKVRDVESQKNNLSKKRKKKLGIRDDIGWVQKIKKKRT